MPSNDYLEGFNDGIYHATDFLQSVAKDLEDFESDGAEDADLIYNLADVLLEDIKDIPEDD